MPAYKWEVLKKKAIACAERMDGFHTASDIGAYAVIASLQDGFKSTWRENVDEIRARLIQEINQWDVRMCRKLIDAFPTIVPERYRNAVPTCEYNDAGDWVLVYG